MPSRVLVVDDEPDIRALVAYHLAREGYTVATAADGPEALDSARAEHPDVIVLDLMLPGMSGYDVLQALRQDQSTSEAGVIVLTARSEIPEKIKGLSLGADDYLTKPFSPAELALRIAGLLRRMSAPSITSGGVTVVGPMTIARDQQLVTLNGEAVRLTPSEYRVLLTLVDRRGRVLSRDFLQEHALDLQPGIMTRAVIMHVQRLRTKLGSEIGTMIETVRGIGYRFANNPSGKRP